MIVTSSRVRKMSSGAISKMIDKHLKALNCIEDTESVEFTFLLHQLDRIEREFYSRPGAVQGRKLH
jgi:predicted nucleotidyltransferase